MNITAQTAMDIALAHREIETAEKLLSDIQETVTRHEQPDIRDSFGRRTGGLELGVPSGAGSRRCFNVDWALARPILEAHIAKQKALVTALSEKARAELGS